MPAPKINYAVAATMLATGMTYGEIASHFGSGSANTVRQGLLRRGIQAKTVRHLPIPAERCENVVLRVAREAGQRVKQGLDQILEREVTGISKLKTSKSLKQAGRVAAVIEPLARTAKIVYGWGDEDKSGLVVIGRMSEAEPEPHPVIDLPKAESDPTSNPS